MASTGCGGPGGGSLAPTNSGAPPVSGTLLAANIALPMPTAGGFSGVFLLPLNNAASSSTVSQASFTSAPSSAPAATGLGPSDSVIFWVKSIYSSTIRFDAFPITTWALPSNILASATNYELETFDGRTGALLDVEPATNVNENFVSFAGNPKIFTPIGGRSYWWELIALGPPASPLPSASPSAAPYCPGNAAAVSAVSAIGQTLAVPGVCGYSGTLTLPANDATNQTIELQSYAPPNTPLNVPGTTTGLVSIWGNVNANVTLNSPYALLAVKLAPSVSTRPKGYFISAETCVTDEHGKLACAANIQGPLPIIGRTLFGGFPFPATLLGPSGACGAKPCSTYSYIASLYY